MLKRTVLFLSILLISCNCQKEKEDGWTKIFNEKDLTGWKLAPNKNSNPKGGNGSAKYVVEDGAIVGTTEKVGVRVNSFLISEKSYKNFELKFEVKLDKELNSGVQIRSITKKNHKNYRLHGPQVEVAYTGYAGYIYGEGYHGWFIPKKKLKKHDYFKEGWNKFHVKAIGKTIHTYINGNHVGELTHEKVFYEGHIGLQIHWIRKGGPYKAAWKNIRIKELP